jgi:hypothetical protein
MQERGELDQMALLEFAKARQYAATIAALAALCSAPVDTIKEMLNEGRNEPLLVFCKLRGRHGLPCVFCCRTICSEEQLLKTSSIN